MKINELKESCIAVENVYLDKEAVKTEEKSIFESNFDFSDKEILVTGNTMAGISLWLASKWSCRVTGIDSDYYKIEIGEIVKTKHKTRNVKFEQRDVLLQPITEKYDYIIINDLVEGLPLQIFEALLRKLSNALKPNGSVIIEFKPKRSRKPDHDKSGIWNRTKSIFHLNAHSTQNQTEDFSDQYTQLNQDKIVIISRRSGLKLSKRITRSSLDQFAIFRNANLSRGIFKPFVTKEYLVVSKKEVAVQKQVKRRIAAVI